MELTFAQAAKGVNKEMTVHIEDMCQRCGGRGHEPGSKVQHCGSCNGTGMVSDALERISSFRRVWWLCICGSSLQETVNTGPFVMRSTCDAVAGGARSSPRPVRRAGDGTDQTEEDRHGACSCRWVSCFSLVKRHWLQGMDWVLRVCLLWRSGIEDGQTVRMPVGKKEIFITFRVSTSALFSGFRSMRCRDYS